jgi:hypothetical protein
LFIFGTNLSYSNFRGYTGERGVLVDQSDIIAIVGVIVAVIAIFVSIAIAIRTKNKKELSYEVLSATSLISVNDKDIQKTLKITLNGNEIKDDISLVLVRIINSGNVPVKESDFNDDINISASSPIIWADIKERKPSNLYPELETDIGEIFDVITVKPLLMNSGDEFTVKMLVKSLKNEEEIDVDSRIEGIHKIKKLEISFSRLPIYSLAIVTFILATLLPFLDKGIYSGVYAGIIIGFIVQIVVEYIGYRKKKKTKNL